MTLMFCQILTSDILIKNIGKQHLILLCVVRCSDLKIPLRCLNLLLQLLVDLTHMRCTSLSLLLLDGSKQKATFFCLHYSKQVDLDHHTTNAPFSNV